MPTIICGAYPKGVIREEEFIITDQEILEMKERIIEAVKEISSGAFLSLPCDPDQSSYCDLVERLRENG